MSNQEIQKRAYAKAQAIVLSRCSEPLRDAIQTWKESGRGINGNGASGIVDAVTNLVAQGIEQVLTSECKALESEIARLKELQTWIVQDEFEFYGYKFLRYKNEEGLFGYSDEKSEEITCGFSSEDLMFAHAETVVREAAEDRACEVYEP